MRDRFTRVLKGHIALATVRFPEGTTGAALDAFARKPLWDAGLDYDHGTGHGVGAYLSVHEGPQNISKRPVTQALKPGMICSNEPGYYKAGEYGIRIENLVVVTEPEDAGRRSPDDAISKPSRSRRSISISSSPRCSPKKSATGSTPITRACAKQLSPRAGRRKHEPGSNNAHAGDMTDDGEAHDARFPRRGRTRPMTKLISIDSARLKSNPSWQAIADSSAIRAHRRCLCSGRA